MGRRPSLADLLPPEPDPVPATGDAKDAVTPEPEPDVPAREEAEAPSVDDGASHPPAEADGGKPAASQVPEPAVEPEPAHAPAAAASQAPAPTPMPDQDGDDRPLPRWQTLERVDARIRTDQADDVDALVRRLNRDRRHRGKSNLSGERITSSTLLRIGLDLVLARAGELAGDDEAAYRRSLGLDDLGR